MESQNLDNQFKKMIEDSENYYQEFSDKARVNIWYKIKKGAEFSVVALWKRIAIAASILLLFTSSTSLYFLKKKDAVLIANLYLQIEQLKAQPIVQNHASISKNKIVVSEKERIVHVPVVKTEIVEKVLYVHDTVYVKQLVVEYKERVVDDIKVEDNLSLTESMGNKQLVQTEYLIAENVKPITKTKQNKLINIENYLKRRIEERNNIESVPWLVFQQNK